MEYVNGGEVSVAMILDASGGFPGRGASLGQRGCRGGGGGVLFFMMNPKNSERYSYLSNNIMIQQLDCVQ